MRSIDIDFEVWKALTAELEHEKETYNDVLRRLLALDSLQEPEAHPHSVVGRIAEFSSTLSDTWNRPESGFYSRGLFLPDGTKLRATYKGDPHYALIEAGKWTNESGQEYSSPSAAATAITQNSVNGWRFWEALRPGDSKWRRLDMLG